MKNNIYALINKDKSASGAEIVDRFNISIDEARTHIMALMADGKVNLFKGIGDLDNDFLNCIFTMRGK